MLLWSLHFGLHPISISMIFITGIFKILTYGYLAQVYLTKLYVKAWRVNHLSLKINSKPSKNILKSILSTFTSTLKHYPTCLEDFYFPTLVQRASWQRASSTKSKLHRTALYSSNLDFVPKLHYMNMHPAKGRVIVSYRQFTFFKLTSHFKWLGAFAFSWGNCCYWDSTQLELKEIPGLICLRLLIRIVRNFTYMIQSSWTITSGRNLLTCKLMSNSLEYNRRGLLGVCSASGRLAHVVTTRDLIW